MIRTLLATCIGLVGMLAPASASGQWWPGFAPVGFDGPVNAMIDFEGATIVGGSFYAIGGDVMSASTVWDGNGFAELPAANSLGLVSDFIVHGGELFARSNGALERWTGSEWERIAWGLSFYPNGKADLASFGGELVIAGNFLASLNSGVRVTCPHDLPPTVGPPTVTEPGSIQPHPGQHRRHRTTTATSGAQSTFPEQEAVTPRRHSYSFCVFIESRPRSDSKPYLQT